MHFQNKLSLAVQYFLQDRCKFKIDIYVSASVPALTAGKSNLMIQSQVKIYIYSFSFLDWIGYTWGSSRRSLEFAEMKRSHTEGLSERSHRRRTKSFSFLHTNKVWEVTAVAHDQKPVPYLTGVCVLMTSSDESYSVSITPEWRYWDIIQIVVCLFVCVWPLHQNLMETNLSTVWYLS